MSRDVWTTDELLERIANVLERIADCLEPAPRSAGRIVPVPEDERYAELTREMPNGERIVTRYKAVDAEASS